MQVSHTSVSHSTTTSNSPAASLKPTRFAQARGILSLRRVPSRLGEGATKEQGTLQGLAQASPFSPRREHPSLKKNSSRLGDNSNGRAPDNLT